MSFFFKSKRDTKNTSDNNISITTNTDIMFNVGKDLGEIKNILKSLAEKDELIITRLNEHELRITKLEKGRRKNG